MKAGDISNIHHIELHRDEDTRPTTNDVIHRGGGARTQVTLGHDRAQDGHRMDARFDIDWTDMEVSVADTTRSILHLID